MPEVVDELGRRRQAFVVASPRLERNEVARVYLTFVFASPHFKMWRKCSLSTG